MGFVKFIFRAGGGKSGGYRTISVFGGTDMRIFLITVFAKNEKNNLTRAEQVAAVELAKALVATYRDRRWVRMTALCRG